MKIRNKWKDMTTDIAGIKIMRVFLEWLYTKTLDLLRWNGRISEWNKLLKLTKKKEEKLNIHTYD